MRTSTACRLFFKAAESEVGDEVTGRLVESEMKRIRADRDFLAQADEKLKHWSELEAKGALTEEDRKERKLTEQERSAIDPQWLLWPEQRTDADQDRDVRLLSERTRPQVLAAFNNQLPFLVERQIGRGQVLFVASGMLSSWNTLPKTNAMLLMDRVLRGMLERTLPVTEFQFDRTNRAPGGRSQCPVQCYPTGQRDSTRQFLGGARFGRCLGRRSVWGRHPECFPTRHL